MSVFLIDNRRIGFHFVAATFLLVAFRLRTETPDMQIALFDAVIRHRRQRLLNLLSFTFGFCVHVYNCFLRFELLFAQPPV